MVYQQLIELIRAAPVVQRCMLSFLHFQFHFRSEMAFLFRVFFYFTGSPEYYCLLNMLAFLFVYFYSFMMHKNSLSSPRRSWHNTHKKLNKSTIGATRGLGICPAISLHHPKALPFRLSHSEPLRCAIFLALLFPYLISGQTLVHGMLGGSL